ncbi:hypothetical protein AB0892_06430 [Streptomyces sp. NPDC005409]|uniref:SMODS domain-containing nucleotidyltransferase n=1 Tax=Streptomyces sp. NPDC005409 TaxID=3155342 RepID=UPI0034517885
MNRTIARNFEIFFSRISLSGSQQREAFERAESICRFLNLETTLDCFVSGSLSRSTAVRQFSDVDLVATLTYTISPKIQPKSVISSLLSILQAPYPLAQVSENTVRITFTDGPDVDVLPAVRLGNRAPDNESYAIPTFNLNGWQRFSPMELTERVHSINTRLGGNFTRLIKLIKWWSNLHGKPLPSFKIEEIACLAFAREMPQMGHAVAAFFDAAIQQYGATTDAPPEVLRARITAATAVELEGRGDLEGSIKHWGCLLGDQYPTIIV